MHDCSIDIELRKIKNKIASYLLLDRKIFAWISSFASPVANARDLNVDDSFSVPSFSMK
jgi:hypothetical protein